MLGVFSIGRVLNRKMVRSQLSGAMLWGASHALLEKAVMDRRTGAVVNRALAGYLVPVHADIPDIDAVILDGYDDKANAFGVKGAGEIGVCGSGAAIANAIYNATGVRVRDFAITLEKLFRAFPKRAESILDLAEDIIVHAPPQIEQKQIQTANRAVLCEDRR